MGVIGASFYGVNGSGPALYCWKNRLAYVWGIKLILI